MLAVIKKTADLKDDSLQQEGASRWHQSNLDQAAQARLAACVMVSCGAQAPTRSCPQHSVQLQTLGIPMFHG